MKDWYFLGVMETLGNWAEAAVRDAILHTILRDSTAWEFVRLSVGHSFPLPLLNMAR
jgi:hypothetical protein